MNYDGPRQKKDGTWGYTTCNDRDNIPYAIGYCTPFKEWNESTIGAIFGTGEEGQKRYEEYITPFREIAHKFHDGGHATSEEACDCYKQYMLDHELRFRDDSEDARTQHRCEAKDCKEFTSGYAEIGSGFPDMFHLCATHRNRDEVEKLLDVGMSIHS